MLKGMTEFRKVAALTLDEKWYQLVPEKDKTEEMKKLEKQLNDCLKKQGQINNDIKEVKKIKSNIIRDVVKNMEKDDIDPKEQKIINDSQRLIQEAKEKIASLEDEALEIPKKISEANQKLMIASINYFYDKINANNEDIKVLDKWINETRIKLKKNLLIKQDKESKNDSIYAYMHDIFGHEIMGILDKYNET